MKYCGYCGNAIPDDMIFCPKCGKRQSELIQSEISVETETPEKSKEAESPVQSAAEIREEPANTTKPKSKKPLAIVIGIAAVAIIIVGIVSIVLIPNAPKQDTVPDPATELLPSEQLVNEPSDESFTIVGNAEAIENLSRSVVKLTCYDEFENEYCSGSGFFAFEKDLIVTNYHVIDGNVYSIKASSDGKEFNVDYIVNYNERYDLALLKVSEAQIRSNNLDFEPLPVGDSSSVKISEHITAIGVPLGVSKTVSDGMISGFYEDNGVKLIQFTAPISHGSSGGALLNDNGEVIGITSASFSDGQNFNLTVPSSYISILYNANAKRQSIAHFYNQNDHYYSVDYCLKNHNKVSGKKVTIYGYVSSFTRSKDGFIMCFIVPTPEDVDGTYYVAGISPNPNQIEAQQIQNHMDNEIKRVFNLLCIEIIDWNDCCKDDSIFVPGSYILVTGEIQENGGYEKYPSKTMLGIVPSRVKLIS